MKRTKTYARHLTYHTNEHYPDKQKLTAWALQSSDIPTEVYNKPKNSINAI
jgi:hypothetical protein